MDVNFVRICVTVLSFLIFLGICWLAWSKPNQKGFDEAARLPFDEDLPAPVVAPTKRSNRHV